MFKMQAAQQLVEAELSTDRLRHQVRRTGRINWLEPFCDFPFDEPDEKHWRPDSAAQPAAKTKLFPDAVPKVEAWLESQYRGRKIVSDAQSHLTTRPFFRLWNLKPIEFQDVDRYTDPSLAGHDDIQLRKRLLAEYAADCEVLRQELGK